MTQTSSHLNQNYLASLNPAQRKAVETTQGPLLILAGAGTGKTRVLTTRFAHLIISAHARPSQILAVTFTNKAAREMRERIETVLGGSVDGLWLGTFHAICARMLRRHAERVGLKTNFTILDTDDQLRLIKQLMSTRGIDPKQTPPANLAGIIQRWKDRGLTPDRVSSAEDSPLYGGHALSIYRMYQARLIEVNACDFGDLMLHMYEILRTTPRVLEEYQDRFSYIMVDEYQDTNTIQYLWLNLLAKRRGSPSNIACVGDDDQSIYSWRGAEIENILRFEKDFPGATVVRLEENYRSTGTILAAASALIAHNGARMGKTLRPADKAEKGEKIHVIGSWDSDEEARVLADDVKRMREAGDDLNDIAVLVRASFQTRSIEERLLAFGIPYRIIGGLRFYERAEIRDALAYLRVLAQPDDDLAFERIINLPKRGVGAAALQKLHARSRATTRSLFSSVAIALEEKSLSGRIAENLTALITTFSGCKDALSHEGPVVAAQKLLEESGYCQMWRDDKSPDAPGRLDNLKEMLRAMAEFASLNDFLEHVALVTEAETQIDESKVNVMTLHGAKGLEFDTVFLPGWEEGVFPSQRSLDEGGLRSLEEERRLAYVGLTRARRRAIIMHAARRRIFANWQDSLPSRFITELPPEFCTVETRQMRDWGYAPNAAALSRPSRAQFSFAPAAAALPSAQTDAAPPPLGSRVFHQKFGYGAVLEVEGQRLLIRFEKAGEKKVMAAYVECIS